VFAEPLRKREKGNKGLRYRFLLKHMHVFLPVYMWFIFVMRGETGATLWHKLQVTQTLLQVMN